MNTFTARKIQARIANRLRAAWVMLLRARPGFHSSSEASRGRREKNSLSTGTITKGAE